MNGIIIKTRKSGSKDIKLCFLNLEQVVFCSDGKIRLSDGTQLWVYGDHNNEILDALMYDKRKVLENLEFWVTKLR